MSQEDISGTKNHDGLSESLLVASEPSVASVVKHSAQRGKGSSTSGSTTKKKAKKGGLSDSKGNLVQGAECRDSPGITLWDVVMKNRRGSSTKKSAVPKSLTETPLLPSSQETSIDALLTNGKSAVCSTPVDSLDIFQDLFEPADRLTLFDSKPYDSQSSNTPSCGNKEMRGSLRLDEEGNLLFEEPLWLEKIDQGASSFLMEGRIIVDENFNETRVIQPFHGAYKRSKPVKWGEKDEEIFYEGLETFGLDLMMVRTWLPHFSARQIKDKYHVEEKKNAKRVEQALKKRRKITVTHFEKIHGGIDERTHFRPEDDSCSDLHYNEGILEGTSSISQEREDDLLDKLFQDDLLDGPTSLLFEC